MMPDEVIEEPEFRITKREAKRRLKIMKAKEKEALLRYKATEMKRTTSVTDR